MTPETTPTVHSHLGKTHPLLQPRLGLRLNMVTCWAPSLLWPNKQQIGVFCRGCVSKWACHSRVAVIAARASSKFVEHDPLRVPTSSTKHQPTKFPFHVYQQKSQVKPGHMLKRWLINLYIEKKSNLPHLGSLVLFPLIKLGWFTRGLRAWGWSAGATLPVWVLRLLLVRLWPSLSPFSPAPLSDLGISWAPGLDN